MIRAIIVDDEVLNVSNLTSLLARHCPNVEVVGSANSVDQGVVEITNLKPDAVFLDIEMQKKNGFELIKAFKELHFEVVFVTAYDQYAIQAFKFSALDYLLKPINIQDLKATVLKIEKSLNHKKEDARLHNLLEFISNKQNHALKKIALPTLKETFLVPTENIVRCESSNNYTSFYLTNGTVHVISKPIYEFEELLSSSGFIRCHQSHLINKIHVLSILNEDSGYIVLNYSDTKIPISKQKKLLVKELLKI